MTDKDHHEMPITQEDALRTLAAFARTAPGRLPERVSKALTIADRTPTEAKETSLVLDLTNLSKDQLERLAIVLRNGVNTALDANFYDGSPAQARAEDALIAANATADAILSEPRPEPVKSDREVVEEWADFVHWHKDKTLFTLLCGQAASSHTFNGMSLNADAAYAAAAEWVRRKGND